MKAFKLKGKQKATDGRFMHLNFSNVQCSQACEQLMCAEMLFTTGNNPPLTGQVKVCCGSGAFAGVKL